MSQKSAFLLLAAVLTLLVAVSLAPFIPTDWWAIRLLDFPRLYWAAGLLVGLAALIPFLSRFPRSAVMVGGLAVLALGINGAVLWPYRPGGPDREAACPVQRRLSVLVANVQLGNRRADALLAEVRRVQPDLLLVMEADAWWDAALKPLAASMPHVIQEITGSYYGIQLLSRLELVDGGIRYLAQRDTPAVVTGVRLPTGEVVDFIGLHPKPPQVFQSALGRDAELYAAAAVLRQKVEPGLLAGDLNATPWELAVGRMQRLAGLVDPREGRGYVATWNANSAWIRWPLDQVFHEGGFSTISIERLDAFGSDHFPYLARLCRNAGEHVRERPPPRQEDVDAANATLSAAGASERLR